MDPNSSYAILGRMAGDGALVRAMDSEIDRINAEYVKGLCPPCSGTGKVYDEPEEKGQPWPRRICDQCGGSGSK